MQFSGPAASHRSAVKSVRRLACELELVHGESDGIIGADPAMSTVLDTVNKIAPTELTVLIQGETGTGKELVARAIYRRSSNKRSFCCSQLRRHSSHAH